MQESVELKNLTRSMAQEIPSLEQKTIKQSKVIIIYEGIKNYAVEEKLETPGQK